MPGLEERARCLPPLTSTYCTPGAALPLRAFGLHPLSVPAHVLAPARSALQHAALQCVLGLTAVNVAGYFTAPGALACPLVGEPDSPLPLVTLLFCAIDHFQAMKVWLVLVSAARHAFPAVS